MQTYFKKIIISIFIMTFISAGSIQADRLINTDQYSKYSLSDFQPYQFIGTIGNADPTGNSISVNGMIIDIVKSLKLKDKTVTTLLYDMKNRQLPVAFFKTGQKVRVTAFRLPNGAYIGSSILLKSEKTHSKRSKKLSQPN